MAQLLKLSLISLIFSCGLASPGHAMTPITIHPALSACKGKSSSSTCAYQKNSEETIYGICKDSGLSKTEKLLACEKI